jgi:tetratricopeptide (TPR) repeat protein
LAAFRQADYRTTINLAGHAAVDNPRDRNVHLLLSLAMFAAGDYRGAANEAHAVIAIGPLPDWPTLFGLYGNVQTYADQLRALEKFIDAHPQAPEGRLLLGFQYAMEGHQQAAERELRQAVIAMPSDKLAGRLLRQVGGQLPAGLDRQPAPTSPWAE